MDTENKLAWCNAAASVEEDFVNNRLRDLGVSATINPKKLEDIYANDLSALFKADLKTVRTPLFKAMDLYGIDPQYAVTFNLKDANRYKELYPNIIVMFDVKWEAPNLEWHDKNGNRYAVDPMHGTYAGFLSDIRNAVKQGGNKVISYQRRVNDTSGNAKESFVFDVRHLHKLG